MASTRHPLFTLPLRVTLRHCRGKPHERLQALPQAAEVYRDVRTQASCPEPQEEGQESAVPLCQRRVIEAHTAHGWGAQPSANSVRAGPVCRSDPGPGESHDAGAVRSGQQHGVAHGGGRGGKAGDMG